jgi:hypothetical protein
MFCLCIGSICARGYVRMSLFYITCFMFCLCIWSICARGYIRMSLFYITCFMFCLCIWSICTPGYIRMLLYPCGLLSAQGAMSLCCYALSALAQGVMSLCCYALKGSPRTGCHVTFLLCPVSPPLCFALLMQGIFPGIKVDTGLQVGCPSVFIGWSYLRTMVDV